MSDITKLCADFLRNHLATQYSHKLKSSHAHEIVAAFFGYRSRAALLSDIDYPVSALSTATVLAPDIPLMGLRIEQLNDQSLSRHDAMGIAELLSEFLKQSKHFDGEIWLALNLEDYITGDLLFTKDSHIMDELSGVMAETNAEFSSMPQYEDAEIEEFDHAIAVSVSGTYEGEQHEDKPYSGDTIDFEVNIILTRAAGKRGFSDCQIEANGSIQEEYWEDPDIEENLSQFRPKDQFLEMTGGFRFGETPAQFQERQTEIKLIRERVKQGKAKSNDINRLSELLGTESEF
jgi:hypothetical protein